MICKDTLAQALEKWMTCLTQLHHGCKPSSILKLSSVCWWGLQSSSDPMGTGLDPHRGLRAHRCQPTSHFRFTAASGSQLKLEMHEAGNLPSSTLPPFQLEKSGKIYYSNKNKRDGKLWGSLQGRQCFIKAQAGSWGDADFWERPHQMAVSNSSTGKGNVSPRSCDTPAEGWER